MENGTLKIGEPHPSSMLAKKYLDEIGIGRLQMYLEAFSSCAVANNRPAAICAETLYRFIRHKSVSDRYLLGLAWAIRSLEETVLEDKPIGE